MGMIHRDLTPNGRVDHADEAGRYLNQGQAAEKCSGYEAGEVLGQNVSMMMPAPYRENHDGYIERYLKTGERYWYSTEWYGSEKKR